MEAPGNNPKCYDKSIPDPENLVLLSVNKKAIREGF